MDKTKTKLDKNGLIAQARKLEISSDNLTIAESSKRSLKACDKEESIRLWNKYQTKNKPLQLREQLIKRYAYVVNWVIGRFPNLGTADFDREDLLGYGTIGLIEAIDRYNPQAKCSFETFAITRVRGEILDFLRSRDFLSRSGRTRVKRYNEAIAQLEIDLGRVPTESEIKASLDIDTEDLRIIQKESHALIFSLDATEATRPFEDSNITMIDNIASESQSQEDYTEQALLRDKLAKSIDSLNPRDRLIIALYHYQKLTFKEIGEVLGVSESRSSQLHLRALQRLKVLMRGYEI
jgi:RNA polymerase sigma factor for flagellar operon FliA